MKIAEESKFGDCIESARALSRTSKFYWTHKTQDVKKYIGWCMQNQQYINSNAKEA